MVFPKLIITEKATGHSQVIDSGSYVSGYLTLSKAESVRRPKPVDVNALGSLTGFGGHSEEDITYGSVTATLDAGAYTMTYQDANAQGFFAVGRSVHADDPDWEGKLRLAVKDQKVNLAQTMAEYHQVQDMFVKNGTDFIRFIRKLKRGGFVPFSTEAERARQLLLRRIPRQKTTIWPPKLELRSRVTNRYLEYTFGVQPLIQDIVGSVEEFEQACQRPHYRKVSIRATNEARNVRTGRLWIDGRKLEAIDTDKVVIKAQAIVLGESLAAQRLGFTNPIALAWELLPYSFVVDYFIGVGNWLNSFDAMVGIQQCYGTVTRKSKYISTSNLGGYYYVREYGRSVFSSLPGSRPTPQWKPSLGFKRITNILALLSQLKR